MTKKNYSKYEAKEELVTLSFNHVLLHKKDTKIYQVIFLSLLTFLDHEDVPHHNNSSEASIRVLKVKSKVSGGFRTDEGANEFACFHSIAETAKRNGISKFNALYQLISDMAPQSDFFDQMFSKEG